jgi:hypothetical protein
MSLPRNESEARQQEDISRTRVLLALMAGMLVVVFVPFLTNSAFYYDDDVRHYFMPQVMDVGLRLARGELPWITIRSWFGGDYVGEGVLSLFNPLNLGLYWLAARIGDPELAALLIAGIYLCITALGVYTLARNYGAERSWAVVAGLAYCSSSFALYWWAATWWNALVGICWMIWAWTGWRSFVREQRHGLLAFVSTFLLIISGWPHGVIMGALIVVAEILAARDRFVLASRGINVAGLHLPAIAAGRLSRIFLLAACAAGASLLSIYPAYLHAAESPRSAWGILGGHNWVGSLDYLVAAGWPTFLGSSTVFFGSEPSFPSFYLAWFVPPALLLLLYRCHRGLVSDRILLLLCIAAVAVVLSLGPQQAFFLRWPVRFLTFGHVALTIAACIVLPRLELRAAPGRVVWPCYVFSGLLLSYLADPEYLLIHIFLTAIVALGWMLLSSKPPGHRHRSLTAAVFLLLVHSVIHAVWPRNDNVGHWHVPQHAYVENPENFSGDSRVVLMRDDYPCTDGKCPFASGNVGLWETGRALNGYSPTGARPYHTILGFDIWSWTRPLTLDGLALSTYFTRDRVTGKYRYELMRINEFRIAGPILPPLFEQAMRGNWQSEPLPHGVSYKSADPPTDLPGTVSWASEGLTVRGEGMSSLREQVELLGNSVALQDGRIIFARAWYPGYEATLDGRELAVEKYGDFLVSVLVPPGSRGTITLRYLPPGIRWTAPLAAACLLLALAIVIMSRRQAVPGRPPP